MIKNTIIKINELLEWEPHNIFHKINYEWRSYDKPRIEGDLFGVYTVHGTCDNTYNYTDIGNFMMGLPILLEFMLKSIYYGVSWPLYCIIKVPWIILCAIFIPQKWLY